jgi:DNA polymerase-3 subunit gamma/tau
MKMAYLNSAISLAQQDPQELKKKPEPLSKETADKTMAFKKEQVFSIKDLAPKEENAPVKTESKTSTKLPKFDTLKKAVNDDSKKQGDIKEATQTYGNKPFSFEEVKKHWLSFAANLKNEGRKSEYIIMDREISLDKNTIKVKLDNLVQADQLDSFKTDALEYLRKKLDNNNLTLEADVSESESVKKIYTQDEKYKYLAEKYPFLDDMKKRFGLETDF